MHRHRIVLDGPPACCRLTETRSQHRDPLLCCNTTAALPTLVPPARQRRTWSNVKAFSPSDALATCVQHWRVSAGSAGAGSRARAAFAHRHRLALHPHGLPVALPPLPLV